MQRDDNPNQFDKLPIELLQVVLSEAGTAEAITNLMHTSKENAAHITRMLRDPISLLTIMSALPAIEMGRLIRTHFSPTSGNYKAIGAAVSSSNNKAAALVCFAFMTDDVRTLDWGAINKAIQSLKQFKEQSETIKQNLKKLDWIESNLEVMRLILSGTYVPIKSKTYLNLSKSDLSEADHLRGAALRGANLSRANLHGAALRWANLRDADLSGMDLSGVDLSEADLSRANLGGANLRGANLSRANLSWASLRWAKLSEADLRRAKLRGANLRDADLSGANLGGANLCGANLSRANLSWWASLRWAKLSGADLRGATLSRADLYKADLSEADLSEADLSRANLWRANLRGANLRGQHLSMANLSEAKLSGADLHGADLRGADLRGADLKGAKLTDVAVLNNSTKLQAFLTQLDHLGMDNESELILRKAVLHQILDQAKSKEILQAAHDHPYFSRHRDDTKTEDSDIKKAAKKVSIFFALSPTTSQALLQDKIRELELLESTKPKKK